MVDKEYGSKVKKEDDSTEEQDVSTENVSIEDKINMIQEDIADVVKVVEKLVMETQSAKQIGSDIEDMSKSAGEQDDNMTKEELNKASETDDVKEEMNEDEVEKSEGEEEAPKKEDSKEKEDEVKKGGDMVSAEQLDEVNKRVAKLEKGIEQILEAVNKSNQTKETVVEEEVNKSGGVPTKLPVIGETDDGGARAIASVNKGGLARGSTGALIIEQLLDNKIDVVDAIQGKPASE